MDVVFLLWCFTPFVILWIVWKEMNERLSRNFSASLEHLVSKVKLSIASGLGWEGFSLSPSVKFILQLGSLHEVHEVWCPQGEDVWLLGSFSGNVEI